MPQFPHARLAAYIVEDSAVIRENLIATLEELARIDVVGVADNEADAVDWMTTQADACQLIIIDIFLKGGSGLGVLGSARKLEISSRLVVLSNYATPAMRRACSEAGADRFFDKSSELEELIGYCIDLDGAASQSHLR